MLGRKLLVGVTMIIIATPSIVHADIHTMSGLKRVATSIGFLAAATAFAGIVIAVAVHKALKSRRPD